MIERSYNGFRASEDAHDLGVVPLVVGGVEFVGGVRPGEVHTVLAYVAQQFHDRVEPLVSPGCWGWSYRQNRNAANLSCHASATAIDCNAPAHPNGKEAAETFTAAQIAAVHDLLASVPELADVVHWGGDWHAPLTPDSMHFEIHDHDLAKLARVADRITHLEETDMPLSDDDVKKVAAACADAVRREILGGQADAPDGRHLGATITGIKNGVDRLIRKVGA